MRDILGRKIVDGSMVVALIDGMPFSGVVKGKILRGINGDIPLGRGSVIRVDNVEEIEDRRLLSLWKCVNWRKLGWYCVVRKGVRGYALDRGYRIVKGSEDLPFVMVDSWVEKQEGHIPGSVCPSWVEPTEMGQFVTYWLY